MSETIFKGALEAHDVARLAQVTELISGGRCTSLEGEPIYADRGWDQFHSFTYGVVIPELTNKLENTEQRIDVLYDDCTVAGMPFSLDYYLEHIARTEIDQFSVNVDDESDMLDQANSWVSKLRTSGHTRQSDGVIRLDSERPVALTTVSGRPTCAVLDAVYQTQKAESGVDVAVLAHSTGFRGQQLDMQAVLYRVNEGMPFQYFANLYVRQRNGVLRLAALHILDAAAELTEVR
jgi:hypothetical protein